MNERKIILLGTDAYFTSGMLKSVLNACIGNILSLCTSSNNIRIGHFHTNIR